MMKSEYAKQQVTTRLSKAGGPVHIEDLIRRVWQLTDDGDPRWIGVALMNLNREGRVRYPTCDDNHDHRAACTVEWTAA